LSRWDKFERAKVVKKHTRARDLFFHDTFARKRTRTNRSNAFYRSFAFAKFFHIANAFARFGRIVLFEKKKKDFSKIHPSWKPNQTKPTRPPKGFNARNAREHTERERKRKKEGTTRTGGFTGSLFRTSHVDFLRQFFF